MRGKRFALGLQYLLVLVTMGFIPRAMPAQQTVGDYAVLLRNGTKVPLSRNLRGQLDKFSG